MVGLLCGASHVTMAHVAALLLIPATAPILPIAAADASVPVGSLRATLSTDTVPCYGRIEIAVDGAGEFARPMDPECVALEARLVSPSGKSVVVPGFAMRATELAPGQQKDRAGQLTYKPIGPWLWRVRYAPNEIGVYKGAVHVIAPEGARQSDAFEFRVAPSASKGFIRVARGNPCAFEYDDGSPFIPIGHNLSWANGKDRAAVYRKWLDAMVANRCNAIRVWLGSQWCFGIQGDEPYAYSEDAAALMDEVLALCEARGIAVNLCLGNDIRRYENLRADGAAYTQENKRDFFTDAEARKRWTALLRYTAARYGASTSILSWEQWNEMDDNFGAYSGNKAIVAWTEEMCAYVKQLDPHKHLTTNSTGSHRIDFELWACPSVDFAQYHDYGIKPQYAGKAQYEVFSEPLLRLQRTGKPVLLSECGLDKDLHLKDKQGYAFHEALWIGFFAGGAGTGMSWYWDSAIYPLNLYPQYQPFAAFVADLPLNRAPFPPAAAGAMPRNLRCFARAGEWGAAAWVINTRDNWRALVNDGRQPETVSGATLTLPPLAKGEYRVQCLDTWSGAIVKEQRASSDGKPIAVELPPFRIDIAVKALRIE